LSSAYCLLLDADFFFDPEDEGDVLPRNARWHSTDYTALHPTRQNSS
jgi:hypothetical protein